MTIAIRQIHKHFVGEVSGLDLRQPLTKEEAREIESAMDRYAVLVFHEVSIPRQSRGL
ncbi:hypothetical protein [Bradyrhizobium sp.]|uniref:hypothetical protein n=1 Tax=Bradyrhizobium sp. TaxID=376 RepID=UPI002608AB9F|nr:hypothetical protein [Bradyrhizobium sp.]